MALNEVYQDQSSHNDESGNKLIESLDQALSAIANGTEISDPQAVEFKRQIESGKLPTCADSNTEKERIIGKWVNQYRTTLDAVFAEIKFFKGRN